MYAIWGKVTRNIEPSQFRKIESSRKNAKEFCFKEEERINKALNTLKQNEKIDENRFKEIKSTGGQLPRLYGLAKVHKHDIPVRPVLSMPGSPYFKIAEKIFA